MRTFEENLSAVMDGELTGEELLESIDALVESGELRGFWRDSRSLQKTLTKSQNVLVETPPDSVWENVQTATRKQRAKIFKLSGASPQVWAAAASILLIFSLTLAGFLRGTIPEQANARTVQMGAHDGEMSEDRFIELTTELLQADSRYHRKMLEVMQTVNSQVYGINGDVRSDEGRAQNEYNLDNTQGAGQDDISDTNPEVPDQGTEEPARNSSNRDDRPIRVNLW